MVAGTAVGAELKGPTVKAFESYIRANESRIEEELGRGEFLWADRDAGRLQRVRAGEIVIEPYGKKAQIEVPNGLIHDWVGSVFIPGATVGGVLASVQDYDRHKKNYGPEVIDSRLLNRNGDEFNVYLRLKKRKVLTVVLNTEHHVRYFRLSGTRTHSRSYSTKIAEVEHAGEPGERERPVGDDHGFLWRLYSYWRFEERDKGVYVECQAISLTRDVPVALRWLIAPIVRNLPRESLAGTLGNTRSAVEKRGQTHFPLDSAEKASVPFFR